MEEPLIIENFKKYPSAVTSIKVDQNKTSFHYSQEGFELTVLTENIFRLRYSPDGCFEKDFSYALRQNLVPEKTSIKRDGSEKEYVLSTPTITCKVSKETLKIDFYTASGQPVLKDNIGYHWEHNRFLNGNYVFCSKEIQEGEHFFGLGDKPSDLNLRTRRVQNWNSDKYGYEKDTDPIYRDVPFYYGFHHGMAYGIFFDNSYKKFFDFGFEDDTITSFWADGGEMNYYFIFGPELIKVAERYAWLTGTAPLPPMWSLGYHQSKWSYFPESKVKDIANEFRSREIPCDVIHLDIDYMDGFRCFTWDKTRFPDPAALILDLRNQGFKAIPIIDPGIKIDPDYTVFKQGLEKNYFCKRSEGGLMKGEVWPGICCFPDFTNPEARLWWGRLFKDLVKIGIQGIWNDMNEPTVFGNVTFFDDVRHDYDGDNSSHRRAHNVYGMQMARATFEGMKKLLDEKRPFTLTRAGFAGVQRYSAVWTGDNIGSWEHLWLANVQCQRLSISGISFVGSDVGGFIGEPNGQLLARWIQLGVFHPFFRSHSSGDQGDKEPWVFGEKVEKIVKKYIELRYKLLPYIYTTFWQHATYGTPILRPLSFIDQSDPETHYRQDEFGFGDSLLVCPVTAPDSRGRWLYLPKGGWYGYWDEAYYEGGMESWAEAPLDTLPLYVKAGAVLPNYPVQQYVGEKKIETLTLHVYHTDSKLESTLFEDSGDGYGYHRKEFNLVKFTVQGNSKSLKVSRTQASKGFKTDYTAYEMIIHGLPFNPKHAEVDGEIVELKYIKRSYIFRFSCKDSFKKIKIVA